MLMKEISCCFTGHRIIANEKIIEIKRPLEIETVKLINQGVIYFEVGGARGFDSIAALTILRLKINYPQIKLILVLPCKEQTRNWLKSDIEIYNNILSQADKIIYTSEHYFRGCMHKRNRYLVDDTSYCICYLTKNSGGTKYTVDYAMKKGLKIVKLL